MQGGRIQEDLPNRSHGRRGRRAMTGQRRAEPRDTACQVLLVLQGPLAA